MAEWDLAFVRKIARVTADALAPSIRGCCDQIVRVAVSVVEFLLTAALIVRRVPADAKCSWWVLFFGPAIGLRTLAIFWNGCLSTKARPSNSCVIPDGEARRLIVALEVSARGCPATHGD
jgi:hypothetical protein